jgi:hypothetical protein
MQLRDINCESFAVLAYSSPSSRPWLDVGAPPSIEGTPAGGAAFGAAFARPPDERFAAALRGALLAAFFAGFLPALRLADFLAVFPAFFVVFVFFADFFAFLAAILVLLKEVIDMTYMVTYVTCRTKNLTCQVSPSLTASFREQLSPHPSRRT